MSTNSTAIAGQPSHVNPLFGAIALAAVVAVGAVGLAISVGVGTSTSAPAAKAGPAIVTQSTMSGPRSIAQKGLVADQATIAATKDADASVLLGTGLATPYSGSEFGAQYAAWMKAQNAAAAAEFPDYFQRVNVSIVSNAYSGSEFGAQYAAWMKAQNAAAAAEFPDYFARHLVGSSSTSQADDGPTSSLPHQPR